MLDHCKYKILKKYKNPIFNILELIPQTQALWDNLSANPNVTIECNGFDSKIRVFFVSCSGLLLCNGLSYPNGWVADNGVCKKFSVMYMLHYLLFNI